MRWFRLAVLVLLASGCSRPHDEGPALTLATTTSTQDTGLLDVLAPMFEKDTGTQVKVVAVGSGQALELGRRGDADVLLTHAPDAEQRFMAEGYGEQRTPVMHNDFVLVGPQADPAGVAGETSIAESFRRIAQEEALFISRGDESGTHTKELQIWHLAEIQPQGQWYLQAGASMAAVLRMASEKAAYTLSDRGTFAAQRSGLELVVLSQGDPKLRNPYAVIVVSRQKHPHVRHEAARRFAEFLVSPQVQQTISQFGVEEFGEPLFFIEGQTD
jgi:tungstate transport system substrate-binding protein